MFLISQDILAAIFFVSLQATEKDEITLLFYYDEKFSEEEKENAEVVATEVMTDFLDDVVTVKRIVLSYPEKIPVLGIRVFQRYEAYPQE